MEKLTEPIIPEWISAIFEQSEIEVLERLKERNTDYYQLLKKEETMMKQYSFLDKIFDDDGEMTMTGEEHRILVTFMELRARIEETERKAFFLLGHRQCLEYLKAIDMLKC